jgi:glycosyltransferase involved in cell wall biosynthesis
LSPLFSVIVSTRERPLLLERALRSVLAQTCGDFECLVVDDAGAGPPSIPDDPRFRLIRRTTAGGPAATRNDGLDHARGRFVSFLDDDDEYTPERLAIGLEGLRRAPIGVCWRSQVTQDGGRRWTHILDGQVGGRVVAGPIPHVGQCSLPLELAPRFDDTLPASEDVDWWIRVAVLDRAFATERRVGYLQHEHTESRRTDDRSARLRARAQLIERHDAFFLEHPDAAAYQWRRLGGIASAAGDRNLARYAFRRSFRARPNAGALARLVVA